MLLMELFVICHSLWWLVRRGKIIWVKGCRYGLPFNLGIQWRDKREWTYLSLHLNELLHPPKNVFPNYSLTWEVYCCSLLFSDALVPLKVEEQWGMTAPGGSTQTESDALVIHYWQILPKQYHISATQWHSLENKAKKSKGANQLKPKAQASRDR